ncbi:MAG: T9SS type A sorting domain-containing protein [Candidatus Cloacimonetes bacterium]|nr:T9SS type A sorting domain-containing protein [Candidatus Cloacimonadota bacterium]
MKTGKIFIFSVLVLFFFVGDNSLHSDVEFIKSSPSDTREDFFITNINQTNLLENRERDWNYHTQSPVLSSLKIADLDGNGIKDIIMTTYGHQPNPYSSGFVYAIDINGNDLPGWPIEVGSPFSATAAIGDIDNNGINDLVVGSWSTLYAWDSFGNSLPGFPLYYGANKSPVLYNVDDDEELEIIYPSGSSLYIINHDGSVLPGWPVTAPEDIGSPTIADIDNDGEYEFIAGTYQGPVVPESFEIYAWNMDGSVVEGFPFETCGVVKAAPAVGDLDNDGQLEIVAVAYSETNEDSLYVLDAEGNLKPGWPVTVHYGRLSTPALGDIDGDEDLEILIGGYVSYPTYLEKLYAFHHDGNAVTNWPVVLDHPGSAGNINSSPIIADIDGDTTNVEIVVKVHNYIFALHSDASVVDGYPYYLDDEGSSGTFSPTPALGDMDNDGDIELVFSSNSGNLELLDADNAFFPDFEFWPMFKHDQFNTGCIQPEIFTGIEEEQVINSSGYYLNNFPNPFNLETTIFFSTTEHTESTEIIIYNIKGQKIKTLYPFPNRGLGTRNVVWNGTDENNHPVSSGIYFYKLKVNGKYKAVKKCLLLK